MVFSEGTVAVITGAAGAIGRSIANRFAEAGAQVALVDIDEDGLRTAAYEVASVGAVASTFVASIADERALSRVASEVKEQLGPCSILVNNAGVLLRGAITQEMASEHWTRTIEVNLTGAFRSVRAFLPELEATNGCIVNVASIHAYSAVGISVAYTASKGGLKQLTQALAVELAPRRIRVNAVAPGCIKTAMTGQSSSLEGPGGFLSRVPMGRIGEASEVAAAVHFLASDLASYITGATLPVDGGYLAG